MSEQDPGNKAKPKPPAAQDQPRSTTPSTPKPMRPFAELRSLGQPLRESFSEQGRDARVIAHRVREMAKRAEGGQSSQSRPKDSE